MSEETYKETAPKPSTSTQLQHVGVGAFLSVKEAAAQLGISPMTVTRWCQNGRIPATSKPFGGKITYQISAMSVAFFQRQQQEVKVHRETIDRKPHAHYLKPWKKAMETGLMTGKPFSPLTVQDYERHVREFFAHRPALTYQAVRQALMECPIEQFGRRFKKHKSLMSFARFLHDAGQMAPAELEKIKGLRPKENPNPKRLSVNENSCRRVRVSWRR